MGDHSGHQHSAPAAGAKRLLLAMLLTGGYMLVEVIGGLWSGSLALLADAGHMLTDTAALVIIASGWMPIDPLLSMLVALLILRSTWMLLKRSTHILLGGTPEGIDPAAVRADLMAAVPGIDDVHHVHIWALAPATPVITLHAGLAAKGDSQRVLAAIQKRLRERHGIAHATVQIEQGVCADPVSRC